MRIRKSESPSVSIHSNSQVVNVSKEKLGGGFGKSVAPSSLIKRGLFSVLTAFKSLETLRSNQVDTAQLKKDAQQLKLSYRDYLVMLALEHENQQEYPNSDINIVMVRLVIHLMKIKGDHANLIHDLQEVREELSYHLNPLIRKCETSIEKKLVQSRIDCLFP